VAIVDPPGDAFLERANEVAGAGSLGVGSLNLENLRVANLERDVAGALTAASCTRTVEGASTLVLTFEDKDLAFLRAPIVDLDADGQLDSLLVTLDLLRWRLVKVEPAWSASGSEIKLTFEEEAVALLRSHNAPFAMSRANITRAEFAHRLVREVKAYPLGFYSPEEHFHQGVAKSPRTKANRDAQRQPGFADNVTLNVKHVPADGEQLRQMQTVLTVADEMNATGRAREALVVAAIGESGFRVVPNQGGSPYGGVLQGKFRTDSQGPKQFDIDDTEGMTRHFLQGGKGYQAGGAIAAANANPGWSPGTIAYHVEGDRSNFASDQAAEHFYQQWAPEAHAILTAWNGTAGGSSSNTRTAVKPYLFRRGLPGKRETSWDCLQRLAGEVSWRCFCVGSIVYFISEEQLFMSRARAEIGLDTPGINTLKADLDQGKNASQVTLNVDADAWSFPPGSIIALRDLGPLTGRWLVETIDRTDMFDPATEITLSKPVSKKLEPAADTIQVPRGAGSAVAVNPFKNAKDLVVGRVDQGVDLSMRPGSQILAPLPSKLVRIDPSWYAGQPGMFFEVTDGRYKGKFWFLAEQITPSIHVGQTVAAGDEVAKYAPQGTAIEIGWAANSTQTLARATTGYTEGQATPAGKDFQSFLASLGVK
jgi:hypothetical protein